LAKNALADSKQQNNALWSALEGDFGHFDRKQTKLAAFGSVINW
jgi:hypothetical protein